MTSRRRISHFTSGQHVSELRPQLNRIVDEINKRDVAPAGSDASPGFAPNMILLVEIKTLNPANITATLPGKTGTAGVYEYTVELPQTFNESSRGGVTYAYTDINNRVADGTENQQLTPLYAVNDLLLIFFINNGSFWTDMNIDGRQWAKVP